MSTKDVVAQVEKYLSGGQKLDVLEKWMLANGVALNGSDVDKSISMIANQIDIDIIEMRQGMKDEKALRTSWRRMLDGMKYSRK